MSSTLARYSLPVGEDLGAVTEPALIDPLGGEVPLDLVRGAPSTPARPGGVLAAALGSGDQALLGHQARDRVHAHPPAQLAQLGSDPRGSVPAPVANEQ